MSRASIIAVVVAFAALVTYFVAPLRATVSETEAYSAPGLDPMTLPEAQENFYWLAPALLLQIYDAFAQTQEDAIYDTLAGVTDGDALEYLYLERLGAMAGGGLEEEADQTIHEIKLIRADVQRQRTGLQIGAVWQVIGTVGHAEHLHVRGNTYSADLDVGPVEGAWKITGFELLEVNRDAAGETFLAPEALLEGAADG